MLSEDCAQGRFIDRVYGQYYTYTVSAVFLNSQCYVQWHCETHLC